jgi:hypothetical protein
MPRKRVLDEMKQREVCALVAAGCGFEAAAHYVGCNSRTIRREALRDADFYERLRQAELRAGLGPLDALRKASQTHWRAAAWFLERTQPNRFGRRNLGKFTERQFSAMVGHTWAIVIEEVKDPEVLARIQDRLSDMEYEELKDTWAAHASRPDVHRRIQQMIDERKRMFPPPPASEPQPESHSALMNSNQDTDLKQQDAELEP